MQKLVCLSLLALVSLAGGRYVVADSAALERAHYGHYGDVRALYRTGDSLWVGTGGGLLIYDLADGGVVARVITGEGLASGSVRAIAGRGNRVFVGTDRGLSIFDRGSVTELSPERPGRYKGIPLERIRRIDFGLAGEVYLSTFGHGLAVLDEDVGRVITRADSLLDDKVYGVVQVDDTTFYYATSMGLCAYRNGAWAGFQAGARIPRGEIKKILTAPDGGYYLLVGGHGVYRFDGFRATSVSNPDVLPENAISDMVVDALGNLWVCGGFGGVAVYQNQHWTRINEGDATVDRARWRCAYADDDGGVFLGSENGRVFAFRDNVLKRIQVPDELPSGNVRSIVADSSGAVYVLDGSFLLRAPGAKGSFVMDYPTPDVVAMAMSPRGRLWMATRWGVYRREPEGYTEFAPAIAERTPVFSALGFDRAGLLWVGTQRGNVYGYDGEIWTRTGDADELQVGAPLGMVVDGRGRLWVRGLGGNVAFFNGRMWTRHEKADFGDLPAVDLAVSPNGDPVLATNGSIWGYTHAGRWAPLALPNIFENNELDRGETGGWQAAGAKIFAIAFDRAGRLFVGTDDGLAVAGPSGTKWVRSIDGLGGGEVASLFVQDDHALWVGFWRDGLTRIDTKSLW